MYYDLYNYHATQRQVHRPRAVGGTSVRSISDPTVADVFESAVCGCELFKFIQKRVFTSFKAD